MEAYRLGRVGGMPRLALVLALQLVSGPKFAEAVAKKGLAGVPLDRADLSCAWQARVTARYPNVWWPETPGTFNGLYLPKVTDDRIVRLQGHFPKDFPRVRYFSLNTFNWETGRPVGDRGLSDYQLVPDEGSINPYVTRSNSSRPDSYTLYVTPRGDHGYPNELAVCPDNCTIGDALVNLLVITADPNNPMSDCFTDPPEGTLIPRYWGYVQPPSVSVRTSVHGAVDKKKGQQLRGGGGGGGGGGPSVSLEGEEWQHLPTCDQSRPSPLDQTLAESRDIIGLPNLMLWANAINKRNNLVATLPKDLNQTMNIPDVTYFAATVFEGLLPNKYKGKGRVFGKIRGKLVRTAQRTVDGEPHVSDYAAYDTRYFSVSSIGVQPGQPLMQTLSDVRLVSEARSFSPEAAKAFEHSQMYTIIAGPAKGSSCGLYDASQHHFLPSVYNGTALQNWGLLVAWTIPRFMRDGTPDHSTSYAMRQCSDKATDPTKACMVPSTLRRVMGDFHPTVDWYLCDSSTGTLTPIEETLE